MFVRLHLQLYYVWSCEAMNVDFADRFVLMPYYCLRHAMKMWPHWNRLHPIKLNRLVSFSFQSIYSKFLWLFRTVLISIEKGFEYGFYLLRYCIEMQANNFQTYDTMKCTNEHNDDDNNKNNKNQNKKFQKKIKSNSWSKKCWTIDDDDIFIEIICKTTQKKQIPKNGPKARITQKIDACDKNSEKNKQWKAIRYYFGSFNSL